MEWEIPPLYEVCVPPGPPPEYKKPPGWRSRFFSWLKSKVSINFREREKPPKYMIQARNIYGNIIEIDPDSLWFVVDD